MQILTKEYQKHSKELPLQDTFLRCSMKRNEKINQHLNYVRLHPVDCFYEDFKSLLLSLKTTTYHLISILEVKNQSLLRKL